MTRPLRVAVIPTRDRHAMLADCVDSVVEQVDAVYIIDNGSAPPIDTTLWGRRAVALLVPDDPPNISRLWNWGLAMAELRAGQVGANEWDVAVLNSDVVVPAGWVDALSTAMRSTSAVLAYPDQFGGTEQVLHTKAGPVDLRQRITGYAFMLRGEAGLRADESMVWHYSDDDLDWTARERVGALLVPGIPAEHRDPDGSIRDRPALAEQAVRDRETFIAKWGRAPH